MTRRARPRLAALLAGLLLVGVPAGCSGGASDPSPSPSPSPTPPPLPPPSVGWEALPGVSSSVPLEESVLGLKWNWSQAETLGYAEEVGPGATFTEVEWCEVEPTPTTRDWSLTDATVDRSAELGYDVLLKIRTGQCWATQPPTAGARDTTEVVNKTPSTPPVDLAAYQDFVTEAVTRYAARGVHTYAVENETDVQNFWAGEVADYEALVRAAAPVIRTVDPEARILDAGISSTSYGVLLAAAAAEAGDWEDALATYRSYYARRIDGGASRWPEVATVTELRRVLRSGPAVRSAEVMAATTRLAQDGVVDAYQLHFYEASTQLPGLLRYVRERVGDLPVEAWEVGVAWPGDQEYPEENAAEVARTVATLLAAGVTRTVFLPLAYTPGPGPQVFRGLVDASGTVLLPGEVFATLAPVLAPGRERTFDPVSVDGGAVRGVLVRGTGTDQQAVLWTESGSRALPLADGDTATDVAGRAVPADGEVEVGPEPVLVSSPSGSLAAALGAG